MSDYDPFAAWYKVAKFIDAAEVTGCKMFHAESYQKFANFDFDKMHEWIEERTIMMTAIFSLPGMVIYLSDALLVWFITTHIQIH